MLPQTSTAPRAVGIDLGTTNLVIARIDGKGEAALVDFAAPDGSGPVFRSALCFWQDEAVRDGLAHAAGHGPLRNSWIFRSGAVFCSHSSLSRATAWLIPHTCLANGCRSKH